MSKGLFLVGTGTDVGKTYVAGLIVKKLWESGVSAGYFKAAMSGNERDERGELIPGDAMFVKEMSGISQLPEEMCPYIYENAVSPHLAARLEGGPVSMNKVKEAFSQVKNRWDYVTLEGSGGILCPIRMGDEELWLPDVIRMGGCGCLLVADAGLGTINYVGLTAFYMKEKGIPLKGIIFNRFQPGDVMHEDNLAMCERLTGVPVVACVQEGDRDLRLSAENLKALYDEMTEE
ncbi:dethiobiotin synthase [Lachnoclostridium sp. An14]|uniref:dethiobiotin synthase n=1 Tax=Lachnoclostridium sp. An14 TaxID=1965562 RepID=UPI000B3989CB|nr:dethiobiotin synthase [Lachnoclostridium sp. An14]OUQ15391.1 dethiobiotin synthase [Lachnoclostridium sp. An14]